MANTPAKENKTPAKAVSRQTYTGTVVSAKMKDSIVVEVKRYIKHEMYGKYMNRSTKLMAHDPGNTKKEGDKVTIEACRPMSKRKNFKVIA
jgi:small subunit ribosomal protein S17